MPGKTEEYAPSATADVPALIAAAGDVAVLAYWEFLNDPGRSPATRKLYPMFGVEPPAPRVPARENALFSRLFRTASPLSAPNT